MPRRSPGPLRRGRTDPRGRTDGRADPTDEREDDAREDDRRPIVSGGLQTRHTRDGEFHVRNIPGAAARKDYRCPGCNHEIPSGTAHVVVWPAQDVSFTESGLEARRHWHGPCWHRRAARGGPGRPS